MNRTISAIPTRYGGTVYRSRLEARWAAMFDLLSIPFVYEPMDLNGYIPDFLLTGKIPTLVEVRPCVTLDDYEEVAREMEQRVGYVRTGYPASQCWASLDSDPFHSHAWPHDLLILGVGVAVSIDPGDGWESGAGYLGEFIAPWWGCRCEACLDAERDAFPWRPAGVDDTPWDWAVGQWRECKDDHRASISHPVQSFAGRPCGCYDGSIASPPRGDMTYLWSRAHEVTRWTPQ